MLECLINLQQRTSSDDLVNKVTKLKWAVFVKRREHGRSLAKCVMIT